MHLIIGGAYQGKLDYAKTRFALSESDIFTCSENTGKVDFHKKCVYRLEEYTLWCARNQTDAVIAFQKQAGAWKNSILICGDIFCGVVPLGADLRAWREITGRLCAYLAQKADSVTRIFCGLEHKLK